MNHPHRRFQLHAVNDAAALAHKLTQQSWPLCTAFLLEDYVFLNDSYHVRAMQCYAVVKLGDHLPIEIEIITFSWYTTPQAQKIIERYICGEHDHTPLGTIQLLYLDAPNDHIHCPLCQ